MLVADLLESDLVKVDCSDQQGRTALELAVSGNDVDVVCYLLAVSYTHLTLPTTAEV